MSRSTLFSVVAVVAIWLAATGTSVSQDASLALGLEEAQALAVANQPLLAARAAAARAAREEAVAAGELPDPTLAVEVRSLPANGPDAYSFTRDPDTQLMVGLMQEFPPGDTRRLQGKRKRYEAEALDGDAANTRLLIRRDVGLAWIDAWEARESESLQRANAHEAQLQYEAARVSYETGTMRQSELLEAQVALALAQDRVAAALQRSRRALNQLSRWLPEATERPPAAQLPDWPTPPPVGALLDRMDRHPHLDSESARIKAATADVELAREAYKPGWRAGVGYGYRPDFPEMLTVQVSIDLPLFTGNRQDRTVGARRAQRERAQQAYDDRLREHAADLRISRMELEQLQQRLQRYDGEILPRSGQRVEAALATWKSGNGTLGAVLMARQMELEARLQRLALQADAARHHLNLEYLAGEHS